jgi:hypothetical protein
MMRMDTFGPEILLLGMALLQGTKVMAKRRTIIPPAPLVGEVIPPFEHGAVPLEHKQLSSTLSLKLSQAELMLAYAAEKGKVLAKLDIEAIENALDANTRNACTIEVRKPFWSAYSKLSTAIKPVTGESLFACAFDKGASAVMREWGLLISLLVLILPLSFFMSINTLISNDLNERVKENDSLAVTMLDMRGRSERDTLIALQQFTTTTRFLRRRAKLLNNTMLLGFDPPDSIKREEDPMRDERLLEIKPDQGANEQIVSHIIRT